jgi:hypothetical protein
VACGHAAGPVPGACANNTGGICRGGTICYEPANCHKIMGGLKEPGIASELMMQGGGTDKYWPGFFANSSNAEEMLALQPCSGGTLGSYPATGRLRAPSRPRHGPPSPSQCLIRPLRFRCTTLRTELRPLTREPVPVWISSTFERDIRHSKSTFDIRNRHSAFEIDIRHSKSVAASDLGK